MTLRLAEHLERVRHQLLVGRSQEYALFDSAVESETPPFHILYVYGPGGVGKSTFLRRCIAVCNERGIASFYIDARNVEPSSASFLAAVSTALGIPADIGSLASYTFTRERFVLFIDTYEHLAPLDEWLRDSFLPQLPQNILVVMAGRPAPPSVWRIDPGWREIVRVVSLRNLAPEESADYLLRRGIPEHTHSSIIEFTHGHPLALSLVADVYAQRRHADFHPQSEPDIVRTLLAQFVEKVPGPAHRAALESCALVRVLTEPLLAEMLNTSDVHEVFDWLRELSFVESGPDGIFAHDLAREALTADLRWRNPDLYSELHHRARAYYAGRLQHANSFEQQRILFDYVYLHRNNSAIRTIFTWQNSNGLTVDQLRPGDLPAIAAMVEKHEGAASAAIAEYWCRRQPESVVVLRSGNSTAGFLMALALEQTDKEDLAFDPAVQSSWEYLCKHAPLRTGERSILFRFWMSEDSYQDVSLVQSLIFVNVARYYLTTQRLAYTFFPCARPDFWSAGFSYIDLKRIYKADFSVGDQSYGMYGHDWRLVPPVQWLALLAEREITGVPNAAPARPAEFIVLSESEFASAVHHALRYFLHDDKLRRNPLLRSRLLAECTSGEADDTEKIAALRRIITDTAEYFGHLPREEKLYRTLHRTFFQPAPSQERAAELLGIPFSSYRRYLKAGQQRIVQLLWEREVNSGL